MTVQIDFVPSDYPSPHLEEAAEPIASFVHGSVSLLPELNTFMRLTGNENFRRTADIWLNQFIRNRRKESPDKIHLADLLRNVLSVVADLSEWNELRGILAEKVFEGYFKEKHTGKLMGYGVIVRIDGRKVIYSPLTTKEDDGRRRTVDAGSWDGDFGEFAEVKFSPEGFGTKELGYLKLLEKRLDDVNVSHQIYLVSFDDNDITQGRLQRKGLLEDPSRFEILGLQDIQAF